MVRTTFLKVNWALLSIAILSLAAFIILGFQPWSSCTDDTAAAGCPRDSLSAVPVIASMVLGAAAIIGLVVNLWVHATPRTR